jgi:hypothetical protein
MRQARLLVWLLLSITPSVIAQTAASDGSDSLEIDSYCGSLTNSIEHGDALRHACGFALSLKERLPNFTCDETMKRFTIPRVDVGSTSLSRLPKQYDTISMRVSYEDGQERYSDIARDGSNITDLSFLAGSWSQGEFGSFLRGIFGSETSARFRFRKRASLKGEKALVFEYRVGQAKNNFWLLQTWERSVGGEPSKSSAARPGIHGQLWLSESDFHLVRFEMEATDVAADFPMQTVKNDVLYADTQMGDGTKFVLPALSTSTVCSAALHLCQENQLEFLNCHKFGVKTRILPVQGEPADAQSNH